MYLIYAMQLIFQSVWRGLRSYLFVHFLSD